MLNAHLLSFDRCQRLLEFFFGPEVRLTFLDVSFELFFEIMNVRFCLLRGGSSALVLVFTFNHLCGSFGYLEDGQKQDLKVLMVAKKLLIF